MAITNGRPPGQYVTAGIAVVALMGNVVMFVWQGGRSDVRDLEGRLERTAAQIQAEITELKATIQNTAITLKGDSKDTLALIQTQLSELKVNDRERLSISEHAEFKRQIEKVIDRNTNTISELVVKKDVFENALKDQATRDTLTRDTLETRLKLTQEQLNAMNVELLVRRTQFVGQDAFKQFQTDTVGRLDRARTDTRDLIDILHKYMMADRPSK